MKRNSILFKRKKMYHLLILKCYGNKKLFNNKCCSREEMFCGGSKVMSHYHYCIYPNMEEVKFALRCIPSNFSCTYQLIHAWIPRGNDS